MHPDDPQTGNVVHPRPETRPTAEDVSRAAASRLVAACEAAWLALQRQHPEIPDAVIVLGSGMERGRLVKLGHWWGGQWMVGDGRRAEVLLAGEALHLSPEAVFEVLAHEAAHGVNAARGVKDTSRGGRYHNAAFKEAAESLGLTVSRMNPHGWAQTILGAEAREQYSDAIAAIATEMRLARHVTKLADRNGMDATEGQVSDDQHGGRTRHSSGRAVTASCGCGRRLRIAPSVLAAAPVICGRCGADFAAARIPEVAAERSAEHAHRAEPTPTVGPLEAPQGQTSDLARPAAAVVDRSFLERRRRAVEADGGRSDPFAEGLQRLGDFEAALIEMSRRENDPEARRTLEAFRERRADILEWLAELTTAVVVPFPTGTSPSHHDSEAKQGVETELDLRTIELPLATERPPTPPEPVRRREPPMPDLGA